MDQMGWAERQMRRLLFGSAEAGKLALNMLKRTPTNRRVTAYQAHRMMVARTALDILRMEAGLGREGEWDWLERYLDRVEDYQLTVGDPKNARDSFLEAFRYEVQDEQRKERMPL